MCFSIHWKVLNVYRYCFPNSIQKIKNWQLQIKHTVIQIDALLLKKSVHFHLLSSHHFLKKDSLLNKSSRSQTAINIFFVHPIYDQVSYFHLYCVAWLYMQTHKLNAIQLKNMVQIFIHIYLTKFVYPTYILNFHIAKLRHLFHMVWIYWSHIVTVTAIHFYTRRMTQIQ